MELYLLKSAACLALFFAFYKLVLENTSIHTFKRFYLYGSLLASFLIPLISFTTYAEFSPVIAVASEDAPQIIFTQVEQTTNYWAYILWTIYGLGVLFCSVKFFRNLFSLIQQIQKNPKYRNSSFIQVLLKETVIPHTFFSYIFLNKRQFEDNEIPSEVLLHEQAHAIQKHSLDILFVEFLQIIFWFNPLFYFIKRSIKLNHEFLADRAVLNAGAETSAYQKILLAFSSHASTPALAHSINYSSIKKRFTVMNTHTSKRSIWLRSFLIFPLLSLLIFGFSTREVVKKEIQSEIIQQKATEAELAEYNKLAKKYNAVDIEKRIIKKKDLESLESIYRKMTDAQKANAELFPECVPPPPPSPKTPPTPPNKNGSELNISRSRETGFHFNTQARLDNTTYYYNDKVITLDQANDLLKKNKGLTINVFKENVGNGKVILSDKPILSLKESKMKAPKAPSAENGNLYMAAEAPPAPNSDPVEYIKELGKRGATFYIGPHKYSTDEAIELVRKSKKATIDASKYPEVHLGGC
mgnify:CR=1 FL=1